MGEEISSGEEEMFFPELPEFQVAARLSPATSALSSAPSADDDDPEKCATCKPSSKTVKFTDARSGDKVSRCLISEDDDNDNGGKKEEVLEEEEEEEEKSSEKRGTKGKGSSKV